MEIGTKLGSYEVIAKLGEGGMGEVYRARDTKLGREVALKTLPTHVAADRERVLRFEREAQLLATLNHPNIAAIYGWQETPTGEGGAPVCCIAMELVEGESLAARLTRGPMTPEETQAVVRQMIDALEAAHERGIVHRDLKPANVMLTSDGQAKILDFGLAKAFEATPAPNATNSPTLSLAATQAGVILGTAAYMSPEQAKGRIADKRSDVWALGCVWFEMLTGKRAFDGEDVTDTLAAIVRGEPDWQALAGHATPQVSAIIKRCLTKDRKSRIPDVSVVRFMLDETAVVETRAVVQPPPRRLARAIRTAVAMLAIAAAGFAGWYLKPAPQRAVSRFSIGLPEGQAFTGSTRQSLAISPDGSQIAYVANTRLFLRSMSELEARPIQGTDNFGGVSSPVFSPDGASIAFHAISDATLKRIATTGGAAVTICPAVVPLGMSWGPDGILFGQRQGIMRVSSNGGQPEMLVSAKAGEVLALPQMLPGGELVMFTVSAGSGSGSENWDKARIVAERLASGERTTLIDGGSDGRYMPTGHLMYALSGTLLAVPFDLERQQITGGPVPIVEGVRRAPVSGAAHAAVSSSGSLFYFPGPASSGSGRSDIGFIDRKGNIDPFKLQAGTYQFPRVSSNGRRVAFQTDDGKEAIVWTYEVGGGRAMQRLSFGGNNRFPIWSADSKRVIFQSDRDGDLGLFWQPADGTGTAERLTTAAKGESHVANAASPAGDLVLFDVVKDTARTLWTLALRDKKVMQVESVQATIPTNALFSPDGRWVAYVSDSGNRMTIYVEPFPRTGGKYQLFRPTGGPHEMVWSPDGKELFYNAGPNTFEAVSVATVPTFAFGNPSSVVKPFQTTARESRRAYDIAPDGRFVGVITADQTQGGNPSAQFNQITVVLNWFEELKQRVRRQQ